jgi:Ca2+/Na+ antiporter
MITAIAMVTVVAVLNILPDLGSSVSVVLTLKLGVSVTLLLQIVGSRKYGFEVVSNGIKLTPNLM